MKNFMKKCFKIPKSPKNNNIKINNQDYYDQFAKTYENKRNKGYHKMIDDLEISIVLENINKNSEVLEVGCGTGLILKEITKKTKKAVGIDLSENMLLKAKERNLEVYKSDAQNMPFEDNSFNVVYSFKVLAHIENIEETLKEIKRVLKPNGIAILEFYNKYSMRTLIKKFKPSNKISQKITDDSVFTRYDSIQNIKNYLPENFKIQNIQGIRIITPSFFVHNIPFVKNLFYKGEFLLKKSIFAKFGGFVVIILKKN